MNFLLTSAGFQNPETTKTFLSQLNKPVNQIKVIFIPTASRTEEEFKYVNISRQELTGVGVKIIVDLKLDHQIDSQEIADADVIYVCGGNTFYLMQQIRKSGFDQILKNFSGLYVGASAGSIVVGPNVEVSGPWDKNDVQLSDTTGMKIVDFAIIPHYQRKEKEIVETLKKKADYEILELTDNQAVFLENGQRVIIGQS